MDLQRLHDIDEELTKSEVAALKFLCMGIVPKKRLENVKDAKDLFLRLEEQALLNDEYFLADLLHTIGRYDLLPLLGTNKGAVSSWLLTQTDATPGILPYRKMLYSLSEDITNENLRVIKFLLEGLPKAKLQDSATFLDVLAEMEKMQRLAINNLDELEKVLDNCDKQLSTKVREFRNSQRPREESPSSPSQPEQGEPMETSRGPSSILETSPADRQSPVAVVTDSENTLNETSDFYSLKRRPRGYCLIINNFYFEKTSSLQNRRGTHRDGEELRRVFKKLHFLTEEKKDLCSEDIRVVIKEFAERDHSQMDAFVCCILSHGLKGTVMGTDGEPVPITDLTQPFTRCFSLVGKPKVFFIQACQGKKIQRLAYIQADGEEQATENEFEEDAKGSTLPSIPIAADFLIGMATVESFMSFRDTSRGSVFIQELCRQLENGLHSNEDILSILTKVNREVSKKVLNGHKQMPEPRYTLTKKLVFTQD